jgi:hypothetical protein
MMVCIFTYQLIYILCIQFYLVVLILLFTGSNILRLLCPNVKLFDNHFILFCRSKSLLMLFYLKGISREPISLFDWILKFHPVNLFIRFEGQIEKIISIWKIVFDFSLIQEGTELNEHHTVRVIRETRCDKGWIWELEVHWPNHICK